MSAHDAKWAKTLRTPDFGDSKLRPDSLKWEDTAPSGLTLEVSDTRFLGCTLRRSMIGTDEVIIRCVFADFHLAGGAVSGQSNTSFAILT